MMAPSSIQAIFLTFWINTMLLLHFLLQVTIMVSLVLKYSSCLRLLNLKLGKGQIDNASLAWPALIQYVAQLSSLSSLILARRMYNGNHQVASHTWSHLDLCNITSYQRKNEMWKNEMALRNIIGVIPTYMRPPYSDCTAGIFPSSPSLPCSTRILLILDQNVDVKPTSFLSAITLPISYVSAFLNTHPLPLSTFPTPIDILHSTRISTPKTISTTPPH
jgi:hypothetical protein